MKSFRVLLIAVVLALPVPANLAAAPAARLGDPGFHAGSQVAGGAGSVRINGLPAARAGDATSCPQICTLPFPPFNVTHGGGTIRTGSPTVLIEGLPAARENDTIEEPALIPYTSCGPPVHAVALGSPNVIIGP